MKNIFDHTNKSHLRILREELVRIKKLISEARQYSADEIWLNMSIADRQSALYSGKCEDKYKDDEWDDIPADLQDLIDLSEYELATMMPMGLASIRATKNLIQSNPGAQQVADMFLKKIGRKSIDVITLNQANQLNLAVQAYINSKNPPNFTRSAADIDWSNADQDGTPNRSDWRGGRIS
jgi:hypothetical protein